MLARKDPATGGVITVDVSLEALSEGDESMNKALTGLLAATLCIASIVAVSYPAAASPRQGRYRHAARSGTNAGTISETSRAWLRGEALTRAAELGDSHPYEIQVVLTTAERAWGVLSPEKQEQAPCRTWPTYAVAMRGKFDGRRSGGEPGRGASTVLSYAVPAKGPKAPGCVYLWTLGGGYPNLDEVGVPVTLGSATPRGSRPAISEGEACARSPCTPLLLRSGNAKHQRPSLSRMGPYASRNWGPAARRRQAITRKHTLHLAPGHYEVQLLEGRTLNEPYDAKTVTLKAGATKAITLEITET